MIIFFAVFGYIFGAIATYVIMREGTKLAYNRGYKKAVKDTKEIEDYFK